MDKVKLIYGICEDNSDIVLLVCDLEFDTNAWAAQRTRKNSFVKLGIVQIETRICKVATNKDFNIEVK